jgi:hypothetical protein
MSRPVPCPICKNPAAQERGRFGNVTGFYCPVHHDFKVADSVLAEDWAKDYGRSEWQAALSKAKRRKGVPLITSNDF